MRGSAELEGVHQESELLLRLLGGEAQTFEDQRLQLRIVNTDRTAADLGAVADEVVGVGAHASRIALEVLHVLGFGRREGVVHGVEALRLVVPLEHRKIHDPQRSELLRIAQAELLGHLQTQGAQLCERLELRTREQEDHVARCGAACFGYGAHLFGRVELVDRRFDGIGFDTDPDESFGAHLRPLDELR